MCKHVWARYVILRSYICNVYIRINQKVVGAPLFHYSERRAEGPNFISLHSTNLLGLTLLDLNEIFAMKSSEFEISHSIEFYKRRKTAKNWWNFYYVEKRIISKLWKISISNFNCKISRSDSRLCQNFTYLSVILSEIGAVK